jgi:membrane protein
VSAVAVAREAARIFSARGARFLGAAIAFYALLSAAPLFVVVLHVVGSVFGRERAEESLWSGLGRWLTPGALESLRALTERLEHAEGTGIVGALLVIYASTRLFRALHRALNLIWGLDLEGIERARPRVRRYAVRYGRAIALTAFVAVLVAVLILVKGAIAIVATLGTRPPPSVLYGVDVITSVVLAFLLFLTLFRFLPDTRVLLREAVLGAFVSTAFFALGSGLVTIYIARKQVADLYAGAGAIVVLVLWVYYSAQAFFVGACVGAALYGAREGSGAASMISS